MSNKVIFSIDADFISLDGNIELGECKFEMSGSSLHLAQTFVAIIEKKKEVFDLLASIVIGEITAKSPKDFDFYMHVIQKARVRFSNEKRKGGK